MIDIVCFFFLFMPAMNMVRESRSLNWIQRISSSLVCVVVLSLYLKSQNFDQKSKSDSNAVKI